MTIQKIILAATLGLTLANSWASDIAIVHAKIYPAPGVAPLVDSTLWIHDGRIVEVSKRVALPEGTKVLACDSCVVLAGFWNSHVHFSEPKWIDAAKRPPQELERQLSDMLTHSGFTSVVDTGSDPGVTVQLRRRIESGEVAGPHIRTAGLPLFPAYALPFYLADLPAAFKERLPQPASPDEARRFVLENHDAGADITKLFTGSIVAPEQVTPMREEIASAAVWQSHQLGSLVFAHATNLAGVRVAMASGVDVLAHAPEDVHGIDPSVIRDLARKHVAIIPTLKLFAQDRNIGEIRNVVLEAHRAGVRLIFGTDTGFLSDYDNSEEFRQLSLAGLNTDDILTMLTTAPAALFKVDSHQGRVAPGFDGDVTILGTDPKTEGVPAFSDVRYTIRGGKVLFDSTQSRQ